MHILAAFLMPLGLDAHVHASYVAMEWMMAKPT